MRLFLASLFLTIFTLTQAQQADWLSKTAPELRPALLAGQKIDCIVWMRDQADLSAARGLRGKALKGQYVFETLRAHAARTQSRVLDALNGYGANSFYLVNAIAVSQADQALIERLCVLPEVARIAPDPWAYFEGAYTTAPAQTSPRSGAEWGIQRINAPLVWDMGYRGQGISIGGADTGYEWQHPAIRASYRGYYAPSDTFDHNYNWHDAIYEQSPLNNNPDNPCGFEAKAPCDDNAHGTHTAGTFTGIDTAGVHIGVAPEARWIGCRNMERGWGRPSSYIECFEWFLAPTDLQDQNPRPDLAPDVINNSWYCAESEGCDNEDVIAIMRTAVSNLKSAGVFVVVSNGNFGASCATTSAPPAYFPESFSVGATRSDDTLAAFSSVGPAIYLADTLLKPDVSAPGQGVRSSVGRNNDSGTYGYSFFSGTSMAGPHVAGAVALILSAAPSLSGEVETLEQIIRESAKPMYAETECLGYSGLDRPNNRYGWGRIDVAAAVALAQILSSSDASSPSPFSLFPNPARAGGELYLVRRGEGVGAAGRWELFDAWGRPVLSRLVAPGQESRVVLPARLASGVYFWRWHSENGVASGTLSVLGDLR